MTWCLWCDAQMPYGAGGFCGGACRARWEARLAEDDAAQARREREEDMLGEEVPERYWDDGREGGESGGA